MQTFQMKQKIDSSTYNDLYPYAICGSVLNLNYDTYFSNKSYTISANGATKFSGTFETFSSGEKVLTVPLEEPNTTYTIVSNGKTRTIQTSEYFSEINFMFRSFAAYIHVTYPAGSTVTCSKSGTILTGNTSGDYTFTVTSTGTWTVSCSSGSQSATNTVSITADGQTKEVSLFYISSTFNDNSWDAIKSAVNAGTAASYWKVGDRKAVSLTGFVGVKAFIDTTTYCYILGFDHNKSVESNNAHALHIGFGASALSGGAYIAFCDYNYDTNITSTSCFNMNTSATITGGWNSCQMKSTICPAFKNTLPTELQNNIRAVTKWQNESSIFGQSSSNEIWLLSEMEIFGKAENSGYTTNQVQYDFYKGVTGWSAASKFKYKDTSTSEAVYWWGRSVTSVSGGNSFCGVSSYGNTTNQNPSRSLGFAPCLCL